MGDEGITRVRRLEVVERAHAKMSRGTLAVTRQPRESDVRGALESAKNDARSCGRRWHAVRWLVAGAEIQMKF